MEQWRQRAGQLRVEVYALYLAYRDPRVPWYSRVFAACLVGYAFSPIDLIPDPIPILGYLDDLILIPLGVMLVVKMIPTQVMAESRDKAKEIIRQGRPVNRVAAVAVFAVWLIFAALVVVFLARML